MRGSPGYERVGLHPLHEHAILERAGLADGFSNRAVQRKRGATPAIQGFDGSEYDQVVALARGEEKIAGVSRNVTCTRGSLQHVARLSVVSTGAAPTTAGSISTMSRRSRSGWSRRAR